MRRIHPLIIALVLGPWPHVTFAAGDGDAGGKPEPLPASGMLESELSLPTAPELFDALAKKKNPRWRTLYRPPLGYTFPERQISAFWFGVHLSDLCLAVQARDAQQTNNLCRDLESFGKNLGVSEPLKEGIVRLNSLAEKQDWKGARAEIEVTSRRVVDALRAQNDHDLATLVRSGEWVRNIQIASAVVDEEAFEDLSFAVAGPELLARLVTKLDAMKNPEKGNGKVENLRKTMRDLHARWTTATPAGATMEDVEATRKAMADVLKLFSARS